MSLKKIFISLAASCLAGFFITAVSAPKTPQEKYIEKYGPLAVKEMYRSGVPASITLAQGLLESRYGLSALAVEGNNHFGIKCHNWKGKKMYYDDDRRGECFRVYASVEESYKDHSDFLRYQDRYKSLFENKTTDYKAWAYGLKKAGYATDPAYPSKLIKLIETYKLYEYDTKTLKQVEKRPAHEEVLDEKRGAIEREVNKKQERLERRRKKKEEAARKKEMRRRKLSNEDFAEPENNLDTIPVPPLKLEAPKKYSQVEAMETFHFSLSREMYSQNGVPFIYSMEGESLAYIAESNELFVREILKYNDMDSNKELLPGTIVYLRPKKNRAAKGIEKYIIDHDGEDLWEISQRYGVKLEAVYKMNSIGPDYKAKEGDTIILRDKDSLGLFKKK